jgi:hypothetical protein
MKQHILMMLGIAFFASPVVAMAGDFSGSWVRNNAKSDPAPNTMYWLTREPNSGGAAGGGRGGGRGPGGRGPAPVPMIVQQDANSLQVTQPQGAVLKYKLDGKPFTRTTETGMQKATITSSVQGDKLVISTTEPYGGMPGNVTLHVNEVWSLSTDGKILTITTTRTAPANEKTFKAVYDRN